MNSPKYSPFTMGQGVPHSRTARSFPLLQALSILLLALLCLIGATDSACAIDKKTALDEGIALPLAAISPDGGWQSENGRSAASGTELVFREANASRKGIRGLEVLIEKVDQPVSLEGARKTMARLHKEGVLAVVCFASEAPARYAAQAASELGMPLLLCHSETLALGPDPLSPNPFLFGLDLDKSFRPKALTQWAETRTNCSWSLFLDRVDPYLSLQGEKTHERLKQKGIDTKVYWFVRSSVADTVARLTESAGESSHWIISWLSPIMSLRVYATARRDQFPVNLFHADIPSDLLRSHDGIFVLDQNIPLQDKDLLNALETRLWTNWATVQNGGLNAEAVRAAIAFQWIRQALESLPEKKLAPKGLAEALETVPAVRVEDFSIPLSPRTHRPAERTVSVLRSKNGKWEEVNQLTVTFP